MRIDPLIRKPLLVLAMLWCVIALGLVGIGRLTPVIQLDSAGYLEFDFQNPWTQTRTIAYPMFVRVVGDPAWIPAAHFLMTGISCCVFALGLRAAHYRPMSVIAASAIVLIGRSVIDLGNHIIADSLGISVAVAATGCFIATLRNAGLFWWIGLTMLTFGAYQVRPAYLFLIPLWPLCSMWLDMFLLRRNLGLPRILRRGLIYALISAVPFVSFCTFRYAIAGHWGLVSFEGINVIGVCAQHLDPEMVDQLPQELRPVALQILVERAAYPDYEEPSDFLAMERMFDPTVYQMVLPALKELGINQAVDVNQTLRDLSSEIVQRKPDVYPNWLRANFIHGLKQIGVISVYSHCNWLMLLLLFMVQLISLFRQPESHPGNDSADAAYIENQILFWIVSVFILGSLMLVALVQPANGRYMSGTACLLPPLTALWLCHFAERRVDWIAAINRTHQ